MNHCGTTSSRPGWRLAAVDPGNQVGISRGAAAGRQDCAGLVYTVLVGFAERDDPAGD